MLLKKGGRDAAGFGNGRGFALKHRGKRIEVALSRAVVWGVVAARALEFDAQKGRGKDVPLGRERRVVLGRHRESRAAATVLAAAHQDQLGDHAVERFIVAQGIVKEKAEWPGAVEGCVEQGGILGQGVEPVTDSMIRAAFVEQQSVDHAIALIGGLVRQKKLDFLHGRRDPDSVEIDAPQKCLVFDARRQCDLGCVDRRRGPCGSGLNPFFQRRALFLAQSVAGRRHAQILVLAANADNQFAGFRFAGNDRGNF